MKNRNIQSAIIAAFVLSFAYGTDAMAQKRPISLEEAIELGIKSSGKLEISKAKVDEAAAGYHEMRNNMLPDLKASGSYLRVNNPSVDLKIKTSSSSGSGSSGSGSSSGASSIKVNQAEYALVNGSIPIFSGLRIHYGIESAKYLEKAARLDAEKDREEVIENTIDAYSNLYKAMKAVDLVKENLAREQQRVKDFTNLEQNGLMARNDLLKVQLQQSNIELSLLEAENNLKISTINMNLLLGLPEQTDLVPDSASFAVQPTVGNAEEWVSTALVNRKDKAALAERIKAAEAGVKAAKGEYFPGVALTGGYIAANVPNVLTLTNALNGGIGLQYNVSSLWKTGAKVQSAKARLHQVEASEGLVNDQIRLEVHNAYQQYLLALSKIDVYRKSIEQANENYRITKNKYDNNLVTTTDLLDADVAQLQAQLNFAFAKTDASVAYKKLLQTSGTLK